MTPERPPRRPVPDRDDHLATIALAASLQRRAVRPPLDPASFWALVDAHGGRVAAAATDAPDGDIRALADRGALAALHQTELEQQGLGLLTPWFCHGPARLETRLQGQASAVWGHGQELGRGVCENRKKVLCLKRDEGGRRSRPRRRRRSPGLLDLRGQGYGESLFAPVVARDGAFAAVEVISAGASDFHCATWPKKDISCAVWSAARGATCCHCVFDRVSGGASSILRCRCRRLCGRRTAPCFSFSQGQTYTDPANALNFRRERVALRKKSARQAQTADR